MRNLMLFFVILLLEFYFDFFALFAQDFPNLCYQFISNNCLPKKNPISYLIECLLNVEVIRFNVSDEDKSVNATTTTAASKPRIDFNSKISADSDFLIEKQASANTSPHALSYSSSSKYSNPTTSSMANNVPSSSTAAATSPTFSSSISSLRLNKNNIDNGFFFFNFNIVMH